MKPSFKLRGKDAFIFKDIVDKALDILSRQYNVDIRYIENFNLCISQLYKANIIENNFITYPVNFEGIFKGNLELHFTKCLNIKEINKIKDFLNLTIKSPLQYYERHLLINELDLHLQNQIDVSKNNIVNINYFKNLKSQNNEIDGNLKIIKKSHPPIFIEGLSFDDNKNMAIELHHFLGYKAFVHFEDIKQNILSYKDIAELKNTTIYIEHFECLSTEMKLIFLDYFTESSPEEQPLIISSAKSEYAFLLRDTLNRTLLKFLSTYHIRLNKPLEQIKREGFTSFLTNILKDPKFFTTH